MYCPRDFAEYSVTLPGLPVVDYRGEGILAGDGKGTGRVKQI